METLASFFTQTAIPDAPKNTGRVPDIGAPKGNLDAYRAYRLPENNIPSKDLPATQLHETMHYRQSAAELNTQFFSVANRNKLQDMIKNYVLIKSTGAYSIDRQSDDDLFLVMRSYYLQYARNAPGATEEELESLNHRVAAYCSDRILVEIEAYKYYRADQANFPSPIAAPTNVNIYGTRTGELKSFF